MLASGVQQSDSAFILFAQLSLCLALCWEHKDAEGTGPNGMLPHVYLLKETGPWASGLPAPTRQALGWGLRLVGDWIAMMPRLGMRLCQCCHQNTAWACVSDVHVSASVFSYEKWEPICTEKELQWSNKATCIKLSSVFGIQEALDKCVY